MVKLITETLTQTLPFEANAIKTLKLPTTGYVTRYELLLRLNVTTDAGGATAREDALARIIRSLRIEFPGARTYFGIPDGRLLKYLNYYDFKGQIHEDSLPTSASVTQDVYAKFNIYFGFAPRNPFDPTVVLPAGELSDLQFTVSWGNASDLGTGYTINEGEITITQRYIALEPGETRKHIFPKGINTPIMTPVTKSIDSIKSDLELQEDIPVGNVITRILLMVLDSAGNRTDDYVSEIGILKPRTKETPFRIKWKNSVLKDRHDYALPSSVTGVTIIDGEEVSGIPVGIDLSLTEVGEWKIGFTTEASGGEIKMAFIQVT